MNKTILLIALALVALLAAAGPPLGAAEDQDRHEEFRRRLDGTDTKDAADLFELAEWCGETGLKKERALVLEMVLAVEPGHEGANRGLGRVKHRGEWVTPEERRTRIAAERAARMRAMGLVEYKGSWVTPAEKEMLEKGFVRHGDRWMTPDEAMAAKGYVKQDGEWVRRDDLHLLKEMRRFTYESEIETAFYSSEHFCVFSEFGEAYNRKLAALLEKGYAWYAGLCGLKEGLGLFDGHKPAVIVFETRENFDAYVTFFSGFQENMTENWTRHARDVLGFAWWDPTCYSVAYKGPRGDEEVAGQILHQTGRILLNRNGYRFHYLPPWLDEGFSALFEFTVTGQNWASGIQGRNLVASVGGSDLFSGGGWRGVLDELVRRGIDPDLTELTAKDADLMDEDDVAKAIGLALFLTDRKDGAFTAFLDAIQRKLPQGAIDWGGPTAVQAHLEAFQRALGATPEEVDLAFRAEWRKRGSGDGTGETPPGSTPEEKR